MFKFGTYEEAVSRGGEQPTKTKWIDRWKADDRRAVFLNARTAVRLVVHGDDFTYSGTKKLIKDRGMMGSEKERNQGGDDLGAGGEMGGGGAGE